MKQMFNSHAITGFFLSSVKAGLVLLVIMGACKDNSTDPEPEVFQLLRTYTQNNTLSFTALNEGISVGAIFTIEFSSAVDTSSVQQSISLIEEGTQSEVPLNLRFEDLNNRIVVSADQELDFQTTYTLAISETLTSEQGAEFPGVSYQLVTENGTIQLVSASVNSENLSQSSTVRNVSYSEVELILTFSEALNQSNYASYFSISPALSVNNHISVDGKEVTLTVTEPLDYYRHYTVTISNGLGGANGFEFDGYSASFQTGLDSTQKFPTITDEELLTKVQEQTFKYFWDFAHPVSGLARERNTSGNLVTIGGSGFGVMAILVGIERNFIGKAEGISRLQTIVNFLENADRFHGVWPHWMNGNTGEVIPFSARDNGADLVETAFMAQALITVREYLDDSIQEEQELIDKIDGLLDSIEWNWFTKGGENVLYWHWSPEYEWQMNLPIRGYNEALIIYVLAASSKNYAIDKEVYTSGWARSGAIQNGNEYYGIELPLGYDFGGPLFFAHYSFLGLDPRNLSDQYADYWQQNTNHSLINRAHSTENPMNFVGYSEQSWGITASDDPGGYSAHSPTNDNGTITPTAALSSMPYTPEESMTALRHFYYILGDKLWGEYGFYDAFNPTQGWWASSTLAIDQGPIIIMIENHRTGLLWDLFMQAPEVQTALDALGFTYE
ncbi:MAG: Ig-like domain-containing protein [Balneolales bacterium]|nr:Ig-like domain-containing protein [Balneolales bacterium]